MTLRGRTKKKKNVGYTGLIAVVRFLMFCEGFHGALSLLCCPLTLPKPTLADNSLTTVIHSGVVCDVVCGDVV